MYWCPIELSIGFRSGHGHMFCGFLVSFGVVVGTVKNWLYIRRFKCRRSLLWWWWGNVQNIKNSLNN